MKVKLCGMRRMEDIRMLNAHPPDFAGFILSKPFRRYVPLEQLIPLCGALDKRIRRVGVFVNEPPEWILPFAPYLDAIQLHGDETAEYIENLRSLTGCRIWKAVRVRTAQDVEKAAQLPADMLLLDSFSERSPGGTGNIAPWKEIVKANIRSPFFLAGGITAENLAQAAAAVHPYGVDVSSALETGGIKDAEKIRRFLLAAESLATDI